MDYKWQSVVKIYSKPECLRKHTCKPSYHNSAADNKPALLLRTFSVHRG